MSVRIKLKRPDEKEYHLNGTISDPGKYVKGKDRNIIIKTRKGNSYHCTIPSNIFSNLHEDDIIDCFLSKDAATEDSDGDTYTMLRQPFIILSPNQDAVQDCFIRAMRGTYLGEQKAAELYSQLKSITKDIPYPVTDNSAAVYGDNGVIPYLSSVSEAYKKYGDVRGVDILQECELKEKQAKKLLMWWYRNRSLRRLHLLGLSNEQIEQCELPLDEIYRIAITKPFTLAPIPMDTCFFILAALKVDPAPEDVRCGEIVRKVAHYVHNMAYVCVKTDTLVHHFPDFFTYLGRLQREYDLIIDKFMTYPRLNHEINVYMTGYLDKLIKETAVDIQQRTKETVASQQENCYSLKTLTEEQKAAIDGALRNKVCIITGAGGTGKSSITKEIHRNLVMRGLKMAACAFTGKAVVRLNEILSTEEGSTPAFTMDLMIAKAQKGIQPDHFDVLLIDECSMVTTKLVWRFVNTFTHKYSIIFCGDCNQLPPISYGFFMKQIIACGRIPIYTLTKNQRIKQAFMSKEEEIKIGKQNEGIAPSEAVFDRTILYNCEELIDPTRDLTEPMDFDVGEGKDASKSTGFYICDEGIEFIAELLSQLRAGGTQYHEITCICPYAKFGFIETINTMFQDIFLPDAEEGEDAYKVKWKVGDRVMLIKNNYIVMIMNGEEGIVTAVEETGIKVQFKISVDKGEVKGDPKHEHLFLFEKESEYESGKGEGDESQWEGKLHTKLLKHSSCVTIHKSQGQEWKYVILYIPPVKNDKGELSSFLNIPLLYVAMSRTILSVWAITSPEILGKISMRKLPVRLDTLGGMLANLRDATIEKIEYVVKIVPKQSLYRGGNGDKPPPKTATTVVEAGYDDDIPFDDIEDYSD